MSFIPETATAKNWKLRFFKKTASTAYAQNSLVDWPDTTPTGYFIPAPAITSKLCGITQFVITASSSDYTSTGLKPVLVPVSGPESTVIATTTGTAAATDIGGRYDLSDAVTVDRSASAVGRFFMTGFISTTKTKGYLLTPAMYAAAA